MGEFRLVFAKPGEAEKTLAMMHDIVDKYDVVTVADANDLVGLQTKVGDNYLGWTDLAPAMITQTREGYILILPEPPEHIPREPTSTRYAEKLTKVFEQSAQDNLPKLTGEIVWVGSRLCTVEINSTEMTELINRLQECVYALYLAKQLADMAKEA